MSFYIIQYDMTKFVLLLCLQDGESALMLALKRGHTEIAKYLLDSKASLDLQSQVDWT